MLIKTIVILFCLVYHIHSNVGNFNLLINSKTINEMDDKFLSVALDTIVIAEKFKLFNMS